MASKKRKLFILDGTSALLNLHDELVEAHKVNILTVKRTVKNTMIELPSESIYMTTDENNASLAGVRFDKTIDLRSNKAVEEKSTKQTMNDALTKIQRIGEVMRHLKLDDPMEAENILKYLLDGKTMKDYYNDKAPQEPKQIQVGVDDIGRSIMMNEGETVLSKTDILTVTDEKKLLDTDYKHLMDTPAIKPDRKLVFDTAQVHHAVTDDKKCSCKGSEGCTDCPKPERARSIPAPLGVSGGCGNPQCYCTGACKKPIFIGYPVGAKLGDNKGETSETFAKNMAENIAKRAGIKTSFTTSDIADALKEVENSMRNLRDLVNALHLNSKPPLADTAHVYNAIALAMKELARSLESKKNTNRGI